MTAIKISSIKTKDQFDDLADVWYQRTKKLFSLAIDENNSNEYRQKALSLAYIMQGRVFSLKSVICKLNTPIPEFRKGLATIVNSNRPEIIQDKKGNIIK